MKTLLRTFLFVASAALSWPQSCTKYTVAYNDSALGVSSTTATKTLVALSAKEKVQGITIKHSAAFTASGLTKLTVSLGTSSTDPFSYAPPFKIHTPAVSGNVTTDSSGVATVTTAAAHNLIVGDRVVLSSCSSGGLNADWPIATTPSTTTFTITGTAVLSATATSCAMTTVSTELPSYYDDGGMFSQSFAGHNLAATFTSTGANLNALSAGSVDVWVCSQILP